MSSHQSEELTPEAADATQNLTDSYGHDAEKGLGTASEPDELKPPSQKTLGPEDNVIVKDELEQIPDKLEVALEQEDDPKALPVWRKWIIVLVICSGALCATCASSMVRIVKSMCNHELRLTASDRLPLRRRVCVGISMSAARSRSLASVCSCWDSVSCTFNLCSSERLS